MKPVTIKLARLTYTIDLPVILLFIAVGLDSISTTMFLSLDAGVEANATLNQLIGISIWLVPVYLFMLEAVFVPFLSRLLRHTFSYTFATLSVALAVNNFSLILFGNAFIIDNIGFNGFLISVVAFGLALFGFLLFRAGLSKRDILYTGLKFLLYLLFIGAIHLAFVGVTLLFP